MKLYSKLTLIFIGILLFSIVNYAQEEATIIEVNEGELVNLKIKASDEDADTLYYTYDPPLNSDGQWQTTYGDYGEWETAITVSDGQINTVKPVIIRVYKSNWPPFLEKIDNILVNEGDTVFIEPFAEDEENDEIEYTISEPIGNDGEWETGFEDSGEYEVEVTATDNLHDLIKEKFTITVNNVNRDPLLAEYVPLEENVEVNENSEQLFAISAEDPDGDSLEYLWELDGEEIAEGDTFTYAPSFEDSGSHILKGTISDGEVLMGVSWTIEVINVNRPPVLEELSDIIVNEGEIIKLEFDVSDPDGDDIRYSISDPIGDNKEWQTTFDDAGSYEIEILVSDGEYTDSTMINVVVQDVDRAPEFEEIGEVYITETQEVEIKLDAVDLDGDSVEYTAENLPPGASFEENIFKFTPNYETVFKTRNWFTSVVKFLRLDNFVYSKKKVFPVKFTAAGKDKATTQIAKIIVEDVNRAPSLLDLDDVYVKEGETAYISPQAIESDNDRVKFSISEPIGNDGKWEVDYDSAGEYVVSVTATDGYISDTKELTVFVENTNRAPVLKDIKPSKVKEGQEVAFDLIVSDPDGDDLEIGVIELPLDATFDSEGFKWVPSYFSAPYKGSSTYEVEFTASDGELSSETKKAVITVEDINQVPSFKDVSPNETITVLQGQSVIFKAPAEDGDLNELTYNWKFGLFDKLEDSTPGVKRTFWKIGVKEVSVEVSDGEDSITKIWVVNVVENPSLKNVVKKTATKKVVEKVITKEKAPKKKTYKLTVV